MSSAPVKRRCAKSAFPALGTAGELPAARHACGGCNRRVSATAGTIFHRTHTPLTVWFEAGRLATASKAGTSALNLKPVLGVMNVESFVAQTDARSRVVLPGRPNTLFIVRPNEDGSLLLTPGRVVSDAQQEYDDNPELQDLLARALASPTVLRPRRSASRA